MRGQVHLRDMLRLMAERLPDGRMRPFNCTAYTYNRGTKEGGQRLEFTDAVLLTKDALPGPPPKTRKGRGRLAADGRRRPDHFGLATRNLLLPDGAVRKVHLYLITEFNGMAVVA